MTSRQEATQASIANKPCQCQAPQQSSMPKPIRSHNKSRHTQAITSILAQTDSHTASQQHTQLGNNVKTWLPATVPSSHTKIKDKFVRCGRVCIFKCTEQAHAALAGTQNLIQKGVQGYRATPPDSSAKRLLSASSSPKAVKQLLTTDAR